MSDKTDIEMVQEAIRLKPDGHSAAAFRMLLDLRETLGGVEQQVHDLRENLQWLHRRIGVEETRTSRSITDWASAGYPGLVERAEKAERERDMLYDAIKRARGVLDGDGIK